VLKAHAALCPMTSTFLQVLSLWMDEHGINAMEPM
jgi:hypothetical protein